MLSIHYNNIEKVHKIKVKEKWLDIKINVCELTWKIKCLISR